MATIPRPAWVIFFACALHWVWGCSLLFSPEPSRIAAWDYYSYLSNFILGLVFMGVATLAYLGCYRNRSAWLMWPQQILLTITAFSQTHLMSAGHYADWVIRPHFFIFRDQIWGILLALFHFVGMFVIVHEHKSMQNCNLKCFIRYPFETGVAVYSICNALLTFSPNSAVLSNLWQLIGGYSLIAVCYQIFSSVSILYGMACRRINVEIMGLIMLCSVFAIRAVALLADMDVTISDLNTTLLAIILIAASATRVYTLINKTCPYQT